MKSLLYIILLVAMTCAASAQKGSVGSAPRIHLDINGTTGVASSFATSQSASNGRIIHDITIEGTFGALMETVTLTCELMAKQATFPMNVSYVDFNGSITELREYSGITVTSVEFPGFDAASKSQINVVIKLRAQELRVTSGGGKFQSKIQLKQKAMLMSNFKMSLKELPTRFLARVSSFKLLPATGGEASKGDSISVFEIWVRGVDGGPWLQWFADATANPSLSKDGEISFMAPDFKSAMATLYLYQVVPVGYEDVSSPEGSKAHVHLRARAARLKLH